MFLLLSLSTLFLLYDAANSIAFDGVKMDEGDMYLCTNYIGCDLREIKKIREVLAVYGPKTKAKGWEVFAEVTGMTDIEDTPEFFAKVLDEMCPLEEEEKKEKFETFLRKLGNFWAEVCENGEMEECKKFDEGASLHSQNLVEYASQGKCGSSAKAKGAADAQETPEVGR